MTAAFYTLGCKLNQYESEALAGNFQSSGIDICNADTEADLYIINTCTVTSKAEQKGRRMIRKFSREHPFSVILVTGCYAQLDPDDLDELGSNVFVISNDNKSAINDLPEYITQNKQHETLLADIVGNFKSKLLNTTENIPDKFRFHTDSFRFHSRAFLKIQDGCDNKCSYCRVSLARGKSVSRSKSDILDRIQSFEANGYKEVVLTGVNITAYQYNGDSFTSLLAAIVSRISGIRIRLSSLEPDMITEELVDVLQSPVICPHFHIPVQTGSDSLLRSINRNYSAQKVYDAVGLLRRCRKNPFIAADIIVGLPGETDDEFMKTENLLKELSFSRIHVFPFSPRPGTPLFKSGNKIPERITGERTKILRSLSEKLYTEYLGEWDKQEVEIILENKRENGSWYGFSENYIKFEVSGVNESDSDIVSDRICKAKINLNEKSSGTASALFLRFL